MNFDETLIITDFPEIITFTVISLESTPSNSGNNKNDMTNFFPAKHKFMKFLWVKETIFG